jgi:acyl-CoA synthetase (AMP-forming)/AMP-acid ligase II
MTESATVITAQQQTDLVDGSSGVLAPNMEAMLVDPTSGKEITKYDTPGELWIAGPNVTMGYLNKEKATNETYTVDKSGRRWLHTGDEVEVRVSKQGNEHYWIVDRIKELIKVPLYLIVSLIVQVKGFQVPPAELEALLLSHELIEDAAVIGVPDEYSGELPKAFVVLKKGTQESKTIAREIQKWVEERKVKYKWLTGGVEFLEMIPKTASGKILRKDLRLKEKEKLKAKL